MYFNHQDWAIRRASSLTGLRSAEPAPFYCFLVRNLTTACEREFTWSFS